MATVPMSLFETRNCATPLCDREAERGADLCSHCLEFSRPVLPPAATLDDVGQHLRSALLALERCRFERDRRDQEGHRVALGELQRRVAAAARATAALSA